MLLLQILGRLRVWHGDREAFTGPPARRLVLGLLALNAGRLTTRRELVEALWGEHPPTSVVNVLHTHAKHLRRLLEPGRQPRVQTGVLETAGDAYRLNLGDDSLDLLRFRRLSRLAEQTEAADPQRAAALYRDALRLWEDDPLCDVPALENHPKVAALREERRRVRLRFWDLMLATGDAAEVVATLALEAAAAPLDEAVQARLIRAYHATGQPVIAFERYEHARRALADELGIDPGPELQAAHRIVLAEHATAAARRVPRQLPAPTTDFTGRGAEFSRLDAALRDGRTSLVVVCGTAGVGKTALAVRWGERRRQDFPDGQLYLDLLGDDRERALTPHDALGRLLAGLGVPDRDIPADAAARQARWRTETDGRRMLLLLDNAGSADQIRPLLPGTTTGLVIVTSRDSLAAVVALHGAARIELDLLPVTDARRLLTALVGERARSDPESAGRLAAICARLPLALRLAAEFAGSQTHLTLAGVVARLERGGPLETLDTLDPGGSAAMRHVFGCSYRLLEPQAQRLFRLLSLNPAPHCSVACAAAMSDVDEPVAARLLHRLATAHLLRVDTLGRYGFHDLLRAYARELALAHDDEAVRARAVAGLVEHYMTTAVAASDALYPGGSASRRHAGLALSPGSAGFTAEAALSWLDGELNAFAAICRIAVTHGRPGHAVGLAAAVHRYLEAGHATEALSVYGHAIEAAQRAGDDEAQAHLRTNLGVVHRLLGHYAEATAQHERALELYRVTGNRHGQARALSNLGIIWERLGDTGSSAERHREAVALYEAIDDPFGHAGALTNLGNLEAFLGEYTQAAQRFRAAREIFAGLGERAGEAIALTNLGRVHTDTGEPARAEAPLREALGLFRELEHRDGAATALSNLGTALGALRRYDAALECLAEALETFRETGHRYGQASVLNATGAVLRGLGRDEAAAALHREALAIASETGDEDERARAASALRALGSP